MAVTKILARDHTFEINTGTVGSPNWVTVNGINSWSHSPEGNDADTTTFDDAGRMSHMKASRGDEFTISGYALEDESNGDEDAGQAACKAWSVLIGPSSVKQFRITSPGDNTLVFLATCTLTVGGGGNDDPSAWECTMKVTGAVTDSTSTSVPGAPGSPVAGAENDAITGTWTAGTGTTVGYEVWVYLDSTDAVVQTFTTTDTSMYATGLTGATDYYFKVRGFNAAGYGAWSALATAVTTT